jgi:hypothetical protein
VAISLGVSLKWVACARAPGDVWLDIKIVGHCDRWNQPPPSVGAGTPSLGFQGRSPWLFLVAQLIKQRGGVIHAWFPVGIGSNPAESTSGK